MIRTIIKIDETACNGCGLCVNACHEGAIGLVNGKARLLRDDYCDGLGNCLPVCPTGAITFEEREAADFDEEAVKQHMQEHKHTKATQTDDRNLTKEEPIKISELTQWPVQIKLAPMNAPYFDGANLLIAADCTAFAYANFHKRFIRNHITLIGCPKLDSVDYSEKLTQIIKNNNIKSIKVVRMEVPCCGGLEYAVKQAIIKSEKMLPWQIVVIGTHGDILSE